MSRGLSPTLLYTKEGCTVAENKNNAVCSICGRHYHKCLSCRDSMKLQPWKMFTDTSECYKVFQAVKGFSTGVYTKEEFKSKLNNIDLSDLENYREHIKAIIKDALIEEEKEELIEEVHEEPLVEPEFMVEEFPVVEKTTISRKRNYRVKDEIDMIE